MLVLESLARAGANHMASIFLGPIEINSNEGVIVTGNSFYVSPTSSSKTITGSGSFNTGIYVTNHNHVSRSNTLDPDFSDANTATGT
ncbi:spore germination protein [Bacillus sinesaloumensis]|uniref:spore germination protein n=1 Tax=Litchfieldia sinesaloumensis TaxID=1926280 RepID=UPI003899343E